MADDGRWIHKGPEIPMQEPDQLFGQYLLQRVRSHGEKIIMVDGLTDDAVSGEQLLARSVSVALELQARGVQPGDVVCVALDNCFEVAYVTLGTIYAGAVFSPFNVDLHADDVRHMLQTAQPKLVLCAPRAYATVRALLPPGGQVVKVRGRTPDWETFLGHSAAEVAAFQAHSSDDYDSPVCILPSSGTTGPPKGVVFSQRSWNAFAQYLELAVLVIPPEVREKDVSLQVTCNFWMSGFYTNIITAITGTPTVIYPKFDVHRILAGIKKYKITTVVLSPQHVAAIAKHPGVEKYDVSSIREFNYTGAPLSPALHALAEKRLKTKLTQVYGQTEVQGILPGPHATEKPNSVGVAAPNAFVKIVNPETDKVVGPNTEGEVCIKSKIMFSEYYKDPKATAEAIDKDGWLHSGDVGYFDKDGYFYICDRYKELIKYRGDHIIPSDIESVLTAHPGVKDAAVVGIEHDYDQERAVGFVALQDGHVVTRRELLQLLRDKLPNYKYLHGGLHFITFIPRTATGKIQRRLLRQQARARSRKSKL